MVNLKKIGSDKDLQDLHRGFIAQPENGLVPMGPIRVVSMQAGDKLSFNSLVLAVALDVVHKWMLAESSLETEDWTANLLVYTASGGQIGANGACSTRGIDQAVIVPQQPHGVVAAEVAISSNGRLPVNIDLAL